MFSGTFKDVMQIFILLKLANMFFFPS